MAQQRSKPPKTRGSSSSATPITTEETTPPIDRALHAFIVRPPSAADHLVVVAYGMQGEQVLADVSTIETRGRAAELTNLAHAAAEKWAQTEQRECRFRALWQQGEKLLGSYQWRAGEGSTTALDGTVDSFLSQQQRHLETMMRLHHEAHSMHADGWAKLLQSAQRRIDQLEKLVGEQGERLRKAGDVDAEIAIAQTAAEIEMRQQRATLLEDRVLPLLAQAIARAQQQQQQSAAPVTGPQPEQRADSNRAGNAS